MWTYCLFIVLKGAELMETARAKSTAEILG